jgi:hypothetical protein
VQDLKKEEEYSTIIVEKIKNDKIGEEVKK